MFQITLLSEANEFESFHCSESIYLHVHAYVLAISVKRGEVELLLTVNIQETIRKNILKSSISKKK
jgi:hypothetical protein